VNYYEFLGINPVDLPNHETKENRLLLKEILDSKFQELAPKYHPDRGGDPEKFKLLLRSITVLGDEFMRNEYDGNEVSYFSDSKFDIDWTKYFTYNPNTSAGIFGNMYAKKIAEILNVNIAFSPEIQEHGYHWVFELKIDEVPLTFSIVYNEDEILSLTNGQNFEHTMPFKLYLYFPSKTLKRTLDHTYALKDPESNEYLIYPKLKSISYEDLIVLQTTNQKQALLYLDNLPKNIEDIKNGNYVDNNINIKKTVTESELKTFDKNTLNKLFALKTPKYEENESAADFIKTIKRNPIQRITTQVIKKKKVN